MQTCLRVTRVRAGHTYVCLPYDIIPSSISGCAYVWRSNATDPTPSSSLCLALCRRLFAGRSVGLWRLHPVRQQDLHSETDPFGLKDAVSVVKPQHIWGGHTHNIYYSAYVITCSMLRVSSSGRLTDSGALTGQRSVLGY